MEFSRPFEKLSKSDAVIAGGKGASLGEMTQAGIPVPEGFVVLSTTFDTFIKKADLVQEVEAILLNVDHKAVHTVEAASEKIQGLIMAAAMPEEIATDIIAGFETLDSKFVAVRSSATAEDGADHAWAGQLDSYLNTKKENVLERVKECWASLFTPRAIFYRFEKGLHLTQISVAVVVQKMINSAMSGIAFSVHPVTEDHNQLIIEAGFGLGEAIVSGQITPDSYVVQKEPREIIDIDIATQERKLVRKETGGSEWAAISENEMGKQVLNDEQIKELSTIILEIEKHYAFPCDIEWAFENGIFYIVQSRPITTLSKKSEGKINNEQASGESNVNKQTPTAAELQQYIDAQEMVYRGKRTPTIFSSKVKILAWTKGYEREIGAGYNTVLINSLGEQFADREGGKAMDEALGGLDMADVRRYITKMAELNTALEISQNTAQSEDNIRDNEEYYITAFSNLLTYFFIVRNLIEPLYETMSTEDQEYINAWRNDDSLFSSMDAYEAAYKKTQTQTQSQSQAQLQTPNEWSLVSKDGELILVDSILTYTRKMMPVNETTIAKSNEIKGRVAYPGIITGKARVVLSRQERDSVEEGEIIVAPMTTVDFIQAMKKAIAFVTDEGGVTSHAAIVAREMKKPCIINTKIATKIIKTGDMIEVDANKGIVTILK